jgi:anti-sigma regulatory factor (Ser/Thr protein kinase)
MGGKTGTRELTIRNALADLHRMSDWITDSTRELEVDREMAVRLKVCALEAVSNVLRYAYADRETHLIGLHLTVAGGRVTLEIDDDGRPFNPLSLPDRSPPPNVDKAQMAGIGVRIIRGLLPQSRYEWRDGRNVLVLAGAAY